MDQVSAEESRSVRNRFGLPAIDRARPFPSPPARRAARVELDRAALGVLAATARAWGISGRTPGATRAN
jgi:hypothetical protein